MGQVYITSKGDARAPEVHFILSHAGSLVYSLYDPN